MSKKEMFKNEILLKMKYHLDKDSMGMLDAALSEALYRVDLVEQETLPTTIENTNEYIIELYMLKRGTTLAESTIKAYVDNCREFLRYMGNKPLTMITQEDVEHYLRQKIREGNRGTTMNNHRRNLNAIFRFMKQYKFITENPMENIEPYKEIHQPVECLAPEDVEVMKEACKNKRDRALLEWLRSTATRKGEIPDVKINQINWQTGQVVIFASKTREYRTVCLDSVAIKYIRDYIEERGLDTSSSEPLFVRLRGGGTLQKTGIYAEVKRIAAAAGIDKRVYPHLFRKTVATNIVRRGGSDLDAGMYLGHRPRGVTASYYIARTEEQTVKVFKDYVASI